MDDGHEFVRKEKYEQTGISVMYQNFSLLMQKVNVPHSQVL
jgi:hypothetical protein